MGSHSDGMQLLNPNHVATVAEEGPISFGRRIRQLAASRGEQVGLILASESGEEQVFSWREIDRRSTQVGRLLASHGLRADATVAVGLPNSPQHVFVTLGAWKLGACVLPIRWDLPAWERRRLLDVARASLVVAEWEDCDPPALSSRQLIEAESLSCEPLADRVATVAVAIGTGGSTGTPKVVVMPFRGEIIPGQSLQPLSGWMGFKRDMTFAVGGPLYHGNPFLMNYLGLLEGFRVVLMQRFSASQWVSLVERHRVNFCTLVPTMMKRIVEVPDIHQRDLSSLLAVLHTAAPCPPKVKESWIELLGGERLFEAFGSIESVGFIAIRGDEWLAHRGSIGRPLLSEVRVLDEEQREQPIGVVGDLYMKRTGTTGPKYVYLGSNAARQTADGFVSVGDLGYVDEDGWYYSADRRQDMIISGGANIYPAEVEAALSEHSAVHGVVVIGIPDPEWGSRVHAIIESVDSNDPPSQASLTAHCRERLAAYKVPKSYEMVMRLPRTEMDKVRRSQLVAERTQSVAAPSGAARLSSGAPSMTPSASDA